VVVEDVTDRRRAEEAERLSLVRFQALARLFEMTSASFQEVADYALDQAVQLTRSRIGYLYFMSPDATKLILYAWSKGVMDQCSVAQPQTVYEVAQTGLWGEAVRQRHPIITNDYAAPNPWKKGLPEGHVPIRRHLNLPVMEGEKIVAVAGVANKESDYDEADVLQLTLIMEALWRHIQRLRVEEGIKASEEKYRTIFDQANDLIWALSPEMTIVALNPAFERITGYAPVEWLGRNPEPLIHPQDWPVAQAEFQRRLQGLPSTNSELRLLCRDGRVKTFEFNSTPIHREGRVAEVIGMGRDISERQAVLQAMRETEERIQAALAEKEVLLREVHHRVKNNLQVISSLFSLQTHRIKDPHLQAAFRESQSRVTAMALVHETLYRTEDLAAIDLRPYLGRLAASVFSIFGVDQSRVRLEVESEALTLDLDLAVPLGLALNELLSNSLKYAFPDGRPGRVSLVARRLEPGQVEIIVADDGVGLPADLDPRSATSLGLMLVMGLIEKQLGGAVRLDREGGTRRSRYSA
jgi:PAS domain S-box-containing protein